jgi:hypothetical protein
VDRIRLDGVSSSGASLSLLAPHFEPDRFLHMDAYWMECRVSLDAGGQSTEVALNMIQPYREDTVDFFEKLASMPDDWVGGARWYSERGELNVDVEKEPSGLMAFRVELRRMAHLDPAAVGEFLVSPDEVHRFASSLRTFMRVAPAPAGRKSPDESPLSRWSFT